MKNDNKVVVSLRTMAMLLGALVLLALPGRPRRFACGAHRHSLALLAQWAGLDTGAGASARRRCPRVSPSNAMINSPGGSVCG